MANLKRSVITILAVLLATSFLLPACKSSTSGEASEAAEGLIVEYNGQETVISMDEILELDETEREVTPTSKEDEEVETRQVKGVLLEDLLQEYIGISQEDPQAIRLIAGDGYSIEVTEDLLMTRDIILAYEMDGRPLDILSKPLQIVIPDVFEMYWVRNLVRIEIVGSRAASDIGVIVMVKSRASQVPDYNYYYSTGAGDAALISEYLIESGEEPENVYIKSVDGLEKNEKPDTFKSAYLKYTGEDSPMFISEDIPKGMWVKNILYFTYGNTAYYSADSGFEVLDMEDIGGMDAVSISDIFSECGLEQSDKYVFEALDGYSVEIDKGSIGSGYLYIQENGLPAVYFKGMPDSNNVKDLLYIKSSG